MKRMASIFYSAFFLINMVGYAHATLIDLGNNVTYDDVTNLYWYSNLKSTYGTTYDEATDYYNNLECAVDTGSGAITLNEFHMATYQEFLSLMANNYSEIEATFFASNYEPDEEYYVGRYDESGAGIDGYTSHYFGGILKDTYSNSWYSYDSVELSDLSIGNSPLAACAWGVSTYNPDPVPEPTSMVLFGMGFIGLFYAKKKKTTRH